ncbi:hypothetical protein [Lignipirellula cremea]|uniref:Uncharacterized protein n=1 Tax=Lignipirellula cremea TaxID=2528010 RepID=A0A518DNY1_9BACT|nr:hypothetical protein [Lignipirellula cremea]QDU93548.1 hypothetical protein Pla8534_13280 [Lignipirellula cremea]
MCGKLFAFKNVKVLQNPHRILGKHFGKPGIVACHSWQGDLAKYGAPGVLFVLEKILPVIYQYNIRLIQRD